MNTTDLSIYNHLFSGSDFDYGPNERYCGHRVIDLRDGVITAKACGLWLGHHGRGFDYVMDRELIWRYTSKPLPGRAPELIEQKQA